MNIEEKTELILLRCKQNALSLNDTKQELLDLFNVSQQRELFDAILDFTENLPMCTEDYSRAELWVKYKELNCA